jgi:Fic family protein
MGSKEERYSQFREAVTSALKMNSEGLDMQELMRLTQSKDLRTFQRKIRSLIAEKLIVKTGKTKNARYHIIPKAEVADAGLPEEGEIDIPLSPPSKKAMERVSRPQGEREPVGHNRLFLQEYLPNITSYLSEKEIEHLTRVGGLAFMDRRPAGTYAAAILNRLLIDLSWNSSRLEGNTYSLLDTERLIVAGQPPDNRTAMETQMILNHKEAIEYIVKGAASVRFDRHTIRNLHALLSNNLLSDPSASGSLRRIPIGIHGSVYLPPAIPQMVEELFDLFLEKVSRINDPFEQAFFAMVHLPYIQPFDDVNKRVSRIAANIPLIKENLIPLSFTDVPSKPYIAGMISIYEMNDIHIFKDVFIWAYERSAQRYGAIQRSIGEPDHFRLRYRDAIRSAIEDVVNNALDHEAAGKIILQKAVMLPESDRTTYLETVGRELLGLHEGNIARYRLELPAFQKWRPVWVKHDPNS